MLNRRQINESKIPMLLALPLSFIGIFTLSLSNTNAQSGSSPGISLGNVIYGAPGTSTVTDPLVNGASFSLPGIPSAVGAPPPLGSGYVPLPPNPGMLLLPPSVVPWANGTAGNQFSVPTSQVVAPANQIDLPNNQISLPTSNATAVPPGVMNSIVGGSVPYGPSTPGADPGMLRPPSFNNGSSQAVAGQSVNSAAALGSVNSNGQIVGTAPISRSVRQSSQDFGLNRTANGYRAQFTSNGTFTQWAPQAGSTTTDFGTGVKQLAIQPPKGKPQISFDAPRPARYPGVPSSNNTGNHSPNLIPAAGKAQVTNDLYGIPMINPNKITTDSSGVVSQGPPQPLTTIIPPPTR